MSEAPPRPLPSLITLLSNRLKLVAREVKGAHASFMLHTLDLGDLLYFSGTESICCIDPVETSPPDEETYLAYRELVGHAEWRYRLKLVTLRNATGELQTRFRQCENTVVITEEDLSALENARTVISPLRQLLRTQLDIQILSPYQHTGAVTGNRFVGRDVQLETIIRHPEKSYLVTGTRMSGKSSLLLEAKRRLEQLDRTGGDSSVPPKVVYVDCKRFDSVSGLIHGVLNSMEDRSSFARPERWESPHRWPQFYHYLRSAAKRRPDKRLHVFLDEYDAVVDLDSKAPSRITWNLRSLYQDNSPERGNIQFVVAGSKQLARLAQNNSSALYNFVDPEGCRLINFEIGPVKKLLSRMEDLGLTIDEPALVADELLHETAGRPSSVQHVCDHVVKHMKKHRKTTVTVAMLRQITQSPDYFHFYKGTLHENAGPLENFILTVVSSQQFSNQGFSQEDISGFLRTEFQLYVDPATLFQSLDDLVNSGFLILDPHYGGERYEVAVPVIKRIYRTMEPASFITKLVNEGLAKREAR